MIDGIKGSVPPFLNISFDDTVPTARRFVSEIGKQSEEHSKNTSITFRGCTSSDISTNCS